MRTDNAKCNEHFSLSAHHCDCHRTLIRTTMHDTHNTIPIVILGQTSVGKSTFLNALLGARVSHTSIQRTTMHAHFYTEDPDVEHLCIKDMYDKKTEIKVDTSSELIHHHRIPKLDTLHAILPLCLVDTPGLDDGECSEQHRTYTNDVLGPIARVYILMVDIHEAFNTSSSRETLQLICDIAKKHASLPYKLLVVVNKCDGMQWNHQPLATSFSMEDQERVDMYAQIETVVRDTTNNCKNLNYKIVPASLANASVYRQLKCHPTLDLPQNDLDRIGCEELGKRVWQKKTDTQKHDWFKTVFLTNDYVERMHETGFTHLCATLSEWLDKESIAQWFVHDALHALEDGTKEYPICEILHTEEESWLVKMCRQMDVCLVLIHRHFAGSSMIDTYTETVKTVLKKRLNRNMDCESNRGLMLIADTLTVIDELCHRAELSMDFRAILQSTKENTIDYHLDRISAEIASSMKYGVIGILPFCHWICKWRSATTCSAILKRSPCNVFF